jgi:uncharacterized repeat protein (TIGR01451 family)
MMKRTITLLIILFLVLALSYAEGVQAGNVETETYLSLTPDLIIETVTWSPANPSVGDTVTFTVTIKNQGTTEANQSSVAYFIDDVFQTSNYLNPLAPSATVTKTFTWKAQVGVHTVKAVADHDNEVAESNEANNIKTYTFSSLAPDLIISSITWSPAKPSKGDTVTFSVKVKNQGSGGTSAARVNFYIDGASRGYQELSRIDAGATVTSTFTWTAQAGSHAIKAIVDQDGWVTESDETNNEKTIEFTTCAPDLIIEKITWLPEEPSERDNATFTVFIKNQGDGKADYSQVAYYIDDIYLSSDFVDPINAGATVNQTFDWIVQRGTHLIKAVADYNEQVAESNETNNGKTVTFSPLIPDLIIESITWTPENPSIADEVTFSVKIKNKGSGRSGTSLVNFYIDGASVGYQNVLEIDSGTVVTKTFIWTAEAGAHAIKAVVDKENQVLESDEGNNEKAVTFSGTSPADLVIGGITWSPTHPSIMDNVIFTVTVKNQGKGKAMNSRVAYYIDDVLLTTDYLNPISDNASANMTFSWQAKEGTHAIKAVADCYNSVIESNETNNVMTVTFSTLIPDLIIESITGLPAEPSIDDDVTFMVTIKNQGSGKAALSRVYFYVDDSYRGYQDVPELDGGGSMLKSFTWTAQAGIHAIKAVADHYNWVKESNETNNVMTVNFPIPDLIIEKITDSPAEPSIDDEVTFTVTIKNQGTSPAGPSRVYFYADNFSEEYQDIPELEAGASMPSAFTWTAQIGTHTFKAVVDPDNKVTEDDENNNEKTKTISILTTDLIIEAIAWTPADPSVNKQVTFTATLKNQGTGTASSAYVHFYVDGSSIGSQAISELEAGATANATFTWTAQGDSHIVKAVADLDNNIKESQENNNEKIMTFSRSQPSAAQTTPAPKPAQKPAATPKPAPKPTTKPTSKPTPTPEAGKPSPIPSLGKGLWLDILFVLVLVALVGTLIKGLMRPKQQ